MSYTKITSFATKDIMADNNPLKVVRGKEFDDEFDAISTAVAAQDTAIAGVVSTPVGGIVMFANTVAPAGFLLCDGAARSRNTYTALFQAIGTLYGAGDGSTTFNVPNFSSRFPFGGPAGQIGGTADAIVVAHTHAATIAISDPGHSHVSSASNVVGNQLLTPGVYGAANHGSSTGSSVTGITATNTISATGSLGTNANLPPFLGVSFIIKT